MKLSGQNLWAGQKNMVAGWVHLFLNLVYLLLVVRIFLKFFFTTANSGFVHWAYNTTDVLLSPLRGVFTDTTATPTNWYVDFPALFALAVYAAVGVLVISVTGFWVKKSR